MPERRTEKEAIAQWNTRAIPPAAQPLIGHGNPIFEETRAAVAAAREKLLAEYKAENERLRAAVSAPQPEPVAWRWCFHGQWFCSIYPAPNNHPCDPLYAAPQPAVSPSDLKEVLANVQAGIVSLRSAGKPVPHAFHLACQALAHMSVTDEERSR